MNRFKTMIATSALLWGLSSSQGANKESDKDSFLDQTKNKKEIIQTETQKDVYTSINFTSDISKSQKKQLESLAFENEAEILFFKDWLSINTFITPKIISRSNFDSLKGNFLVKKVDNTYDLYLPDSIKIYELPSIIKKVNTETFGEKMPEYASTLEIKENIEYTIKYLLSIKTETNKDTIQKAVNKYYQIFQQYFPGENPNITISEKKIDQAYIKQIQVLTKDTALLSNIESILSESLYHHFLEVFFEMGSHMLGEIGDIKNVLEMELFKKELFAVKKTNNKEIISKKEKEIANKIIFELHNFYKKNENNDYFKTEAEQTYPSEIIKSNIANCVGLSIISHQLLSELGIQHEVRIMIGHVALSLMLSNGKQYYFDVMKKNEIEELKLINKTIDAEQIKVGEDTLFTIKGDPEKMFMSAIVFNKGQDMAGKDKNKRLEYIKRALSFYPNNSILYFTLSAAYVANKQYQDALDAIDKAIVLSPNIGLYRSQKKIVLIELEIFDQRYKETENMIKKYRH